MFLRQMFLRHECLLYFDSIIKNLVGDGQNIGEKLKHAANVGMGRGMLGGGAGFFDLQLVEAHNVVKDSGGGPGWVVMMEKQANMTFAPNTVPQASDISQLVLQSQTGGSLPSSSAQVRPRSISDDLVEQGILHMQEVPPFIMDCEYTKLPQTSMVRESEVSAAGKLICVWIAQCFLGLNAGVLLCNILGRSWKVAMPLIPDKGQGDNKILGECRDRGKMIFNQCQNLLYVCQPNPLTAPSTTPLLLPACNPILHPPLHFKCNPSCRRLRSTIVRVS